MSKFAKDVSIVILSFCFCIRLQAQVEEQQPKAPSDQFSYSLSAGRPIENIALPKQVEAERGKITLFIDYPNAKEGKVPVYLINRSDEVKSFPSQDGDLRIRLEFRSEKGNWVRAQVHRNSWCGNSYYQKALPPGQHFAFSGYYPKGEKAVASQVRYRSVSNSLVSNEGPGFYLVEDLEVAKLDDMAAEELPGMWGWFLRDAESFPFSYERDSTIYVDALELLSEYMESAYFRREAERMTARYGVKSDEAKKIQVLLKKKWPESRLSNDELVNLCLNKLEMGKSALVHWSVIRGAFYESALVKPATLERMAELLTAELKGSNMHTVAIASEVFGTTGFADEHFTTDTLLTLMEQVNEQPAFFTIARRLAFRNRFEELAGVGLKTENKDWKYRLVGILASSGKSPNQKFYPRRPESKLEQQFWEQCLQEDLLNTVLNLPKIDESYNSYDRRIQGPVKGYLENLTKEQGQQSRESGELYKLSRLVKFFGTWRMEENRVVLESLLSFPGYSESEVHSSKDGRYLLRDYRVRKEAKNALLNMQVLVDPDIVVEEKIPLRDKKE